MLYRCPLLLPLQQPLKGSSRLAPSQLTLRGGLVASIHLGLPSVTA
jgi:hypothetical protein